METLLRLGLIHIYPWPWRSSPASSSRSSSPAPRPYSVLVFFDATSLHSKTDLHLPQLRREFALLSASFHANNPDSSDLFFADIEFSESQHSFSQFGVNSLPHVRLIRPEHSRLADSEQMDQSHFSRLADSMVEFVEARTGLEVGPIVRPPLVSRNQMILLGLLFLISIPFGIKRIMEGDTLLHDRKLWMAGALFVYFFSVSGGMYGIIRHTPMFITDREDPNKLVFFYQGSGMQLGAEGFAVGFLYTLVGLMIAVMTHLLVKVESLQTQRFAMLAIMAVGWWAVRKVTYGSTVKLMHEKTKVSCFGGDGQSDTGDYWRLEIEGKDKVWKRDQKAV
ncbi:hypothetical protein TRIUR3_02763 [Triticum urartu]|uniref:Magnesium transporter protein 1 n=1 Tax=Triticum urartu TaxID=4572 RepID=M7ZLM4_TRIUA|nr:hypothetical protein TRIUR3_02763 [Triticum urartu]